MPLEPGPLARPTPHREKVFTGPPFQRPHLSSRQDPVLSPSNLFDDRGLHGELDQVERQEPDDILQVERR